MCINFTLAGLFDAGLGSRCKIYAVILKQSYDHIAASTKVVACHDKFGPPLFCSPRSIYFEIFGPPSPYISEIYGPQLKNVDPPPHANSPIVTRILSKCSVVKNYIVINYHEQKLMIILHTMHYDQWLNLKLILQVNFADG